MQTRCGEYKAMALSAKKENDKATAIHCFSTMKRIQAAIDEANFEFDVPPKPSKLEPVKQISKPETSPKPQKHLGQEAETPTQPAVPSTQPNAPPKTLLEGLEQRRLVFFESEQKAIKEGNGSKARRLGRQRKQYDDVIKKVKAGQRPEISHLTVPPNAPPLPGENAAQTRSFEETLQNAANVANNPVDEPASGTFSENDFSFLNPFIGS